MGTGRTGVCPRQHPCRQSLYDRNSECGKQVLIPLENQIWQKHLMEQNARKRCKKRKAEALQTLPNLEAPCTETDKANLERGLKGVKCNHIADDGIWGLYQVVVTGSDQTEYLQVAIMKENDPTRVGSGDDASFFRWVADQTKPLDPNDFSDRSPIHAVYSERSRSPFFGTQKRREKVRLYLQSSKKSRKSLL